MPEKESMPKRRVGAADRMRALQQDIMEFILDQGLALSLIHI